MTLRRLLAALVFLTLAAGHAVAATSGVGTDCPTSVAVAAADDPAGACCGTAEMASCLTACSAVPGVIGVAPADVLLFGAGSALTAVTESTRSVSRPPDTAPPKNLLRLMPPVA